MAYDIMIVVPLMMERWVIAIRTGSSVEIEDAALPKHRRAA
jgi:hypothetical protein